MMMGRGYNGFNHGFMNGYGFMHGNGFMHNEICMAVMAVVLVVVAITFICLIRRNHRRRPASEALEALKIRFAKGEISEDEYLRRKKVIE